MLNFVPALGAAMQTGQVAARRIGLPAGRWAVRAASGGARRALRPLAWASGTIAGAAAALSVIAGAPAPVVEETEPLAWVDIQKPFALYDVNLPGFQQLDRAYEARRHVSGGGRADRLAFGRIGETPYLRFEVYRPGDEAARAPSLFVTAARRAADIGYAVARTGVIDGVDTRFGFVEVADVAIERGRAVQHCLAFQVADDPATAKVMRLSGLSCDARGVSPSRAALACQIGEIQLLAAGDDAALREVFAAADRRPSECGVDRLVGVQPNQRARRAADRGAPRLRGADVAFPDAAADKRQPARDADALAGPDKTASLPTPPRRPKLAQETVRALQALR
jgi:hypothetical protein